MNPELQRILETMRQGKPEQALADIRGFVKKNPRNPEAAQLMALMLVQSGRADEALPVLEQAVRAEPMAPQYRNNLGNALLQLRRFPEASEQFSASVQIHPGYALGWLGLACARVHLQDSSGGEAAAREGLRLQPHWPEMQRQLVIALDMGGRPGEAEKVCRRALALHPDDPGLRSLWLMLLNYLDLPAADIAAGHFDFGRRLAGLGSQPAETDPQLDRVLQVGILSGDLHTHSVAFFAAPLIQHTPAGFGLKVFSLSTRLEDPMARQLRGWAPDWTDVQAFDDHALDRLVRDRKIDILLELQGHTGNNRWGVLARGPAPVMVTAIGYPNTSGLGTIGWRLVDSTTDPPGSESLCSERLLRVDPCFLCYRPPDDAPRPEMPPADQPVTFGSFNSLSRISDRTLQLWSRVLAAVSDARLLLKALSLGDRSACSRLLRRIQSAGIDPSRVDLQPQTPSIAGHLQVYSRVHLCLDTVPYNGTTTTCEALWQGVPVVALLGDRHAGRVSASLLRVVGHPEWVAADEDTFVGIAVGLAGDRARLEEHRLRLRDDLARSPLVDGVGYAGRVYAALRGCWRDWCVSRCGAGG